MKWRIDYSREAEKFIEKQNIRSEVREELKKFLLKMTVTCYSKEEWYSPTYQAMPFVRNVEQEGIAL